MMQARSEWKLLYTVGGLVAFVALGGMLFDIVLATIPGWGTDTVPADAVGWFSQFASNPLLAMRNLDLLNVTLSVVSIPLYVALFGALGRTSPGLATLGLVTVALGTAIFVSANASLSMLGLSERYAASTDPATRAALIAAAESLLARGAHGSAGAFPGFLLSASGTLLMALAMLRRSAFGPRSGWVGTAGASIMLAYTVAYTFSSGDGTLVMAVAVPGGLLMIAWYAMVGARLLRMARTVDAGA
jgi:hypothetical protein